MKTSEARFTKPVFAPCFSVVVNGKYLLPELFYNAIRRSLEGVRSLFWG